MLEFVRPNRVLLSSGFFLVQPLASDRVVVAAPTRPAGVLGRHCAPRPQRPLPPRDRPRYPPRTYEILVSSSSNAEWQQRLTTAPRFIQYIERDVIGNPATFGKLAF